MKGTRVILTGGAGFIGSHIARRLVREHADVTLLVRQATDIWRIRDLVSDVTIVTFGDVIEYDRLACEMDSADYVLHLAFSGVNQSFSDVESIYFHNLHNLNMLLKFAAEKKVRKFIYTGSCFEYPDRSRVDELTLPCASNLYSAAKISGWHLAEAYKRSTDVEIIGLRPFTVYGPFESAYRLIPSTIIKSLTKRDIELTDGYQIRDFVYIDDVVEAYLRVLGSDADLSGEIFNICSGVETTIRGLVTKLAGLVGNTAAIRFGKLPYRENEYMKLSGDHAKIKNFTQWTPAVGLEEGLVRTAEWFRENLARYQA